MYKRFLIFILLGLISFLSLETVSADAGSSYSTARDIDTGTVIYEYLSAGDVDYFHFEIPFSGGGAYNIYSDYYSVDIKATLYEENGALWWLSYDFLTANYDYGYHDNFYLGRNADYDTNKYNYDVSFSSTVDLDPLEDYYIKIQGESSTYSGNYRFRVVRNLEHIYSPEGGQLSEVSRYEGAMDDTYYKLYLDEVGAMIYWLSLEHTTTDDLLFEYEMYGYNAFLLAIGALVPELSVPIGILALVSSALIQNAYEANYPRQEVADIINLQYTSEYEIVDGQLVTTTTYTADNGILLEDYWSWVYEGTVCGTRVLEWSTNYIDGEEGERWLLLD